MKACFQIAECSFSSTKKMQTSAMKACFQIAECSFSSTKILQTESRDASLLAIYAEVQLFFYKDTMIFAEVIYKKQTIICKKQTWFVFCDFFNFPYFKQGHFLFIFILAGNKGN